MYCERYFLFFKNLLSFSWLLLVENSLVSKLSTIDQLIEAILDGNICIYIQSSIVSAEIYQYSLKWWIYNWNFEHTEKFWHGCACRLGNVCQFIAEMAEGGHQRVGGRGPLSLHTTLIKWEKIVTGHSLYYTCITNNESNSFCSSYLYIAQVKCNYIAQVINLDFSNIIIWSSKSLK